MANSLTLLKTDLSDLSDKNKAEFFPRFFKAGPGEYAQGDIFIGVTVPKIRLIAKKYSDLNLKDAEKLLSSKVHEERMASLLILVSKFKNGNLKERKEIFALYLKNTKFINNWDLVDLSADKIVGEYLSDKSKKILYKLAGSESIWERRISVIATYNFIKKDRFAETLEVAEILLNDKHDLIHKAVGWMLREVGKRSIEAEKVFIKKHYRVMPRTMLRYAIEKFPDTVRQKYLLGTI